MTHQRPNVMASCSTSDRSADERSSHIDADCKIWHNDTNAPIGYGWHPVAFAGTWGGAYWKMVRLYHSPETDAMHCW
jgi:hypothetical protein